MNDSSVDLPEPGFPESHNKLGLEASQATYSGRFRIHSQVPWYHERLPLPLSGLDG